MYFVASICLSVSIRSHCWITSWEIQNRALELRNLNIEYCLKPRDIGILKSEYWIFPTDKGILEYRTRFVHFEIWILNIGVKNRNIVILKCGYWNIATPVPAPSEWHSSLSLEQGRTVTRRDAGWPDGMAEWLRRETTEPGVMGSKKLPLGGYRHTDTLFRPRPAVPLLLHINI